VRNFVLAKLVVLEDGQEAAPEAAAEAEVSPVADTAELAAPPAMLLAVAAAPPVEVLVEPPQPAASKATTNTDSTLPSSLAIAGRSEMVDRFMWSLSSTQHRGARAV